METNWITTLILFILFLAALFVFAWIVVEYGKKVSDQADEYEKKYAKIDELLNQASVNEANFDWFNRLFDSLKALPYKNQEMTEILENKFKIKFEQIITKRRMEDLI